MPYLLAILIYAGALLACLGYGWLWLRGLGLQPSRGSRDPLPFLYAAALGMGTLGYLVLAVGLLGWLKPDVLGALVALGWLPAVPALLTFRKKGEPESTAPLNPEPSSVEKWSALLLGVFVGLLAVTTLFSALRPMDSWDWDSLSYHLAAPKIYLEQGRIGFIAYDHHTQFPFTMEMLYTVGLAFGGPAAAKLFHWGAGWLAAIAVGVWTARLTINGRRAPQWAGPLAAALFGSMPVALWEAGTAYIDLGTSLFQFLALAALIDGVRTSNGSEGARFEFRAGCSPSLCRVQDEADGSAGASPSQAGASPSQAGASPSQAGASPSRSRHPDRGVFESEHEREREDGAGGTPALRWGESEREGNRQQHRFTGLDGRNAALAGVLTGFALGTKYTALLQFGLLGLGLLFLLARVDAKARKGVLAGTVAFGAFSVLVAAPWYVKNWLWVHNPVYPFFYSLFPQSFSWSTGQAAGYANEQAGFGRERTPANLLLVFWNLALHGRDFWVNGKHPAGDLLASIGVQWAGLLPLVLWARGLGWRVWALLLYALASVGMWFFLSQQVRYLIPVFAPLAVVLAVTLAALPSVLRAAGGVFSALVLVLNLGLHAPQAMVSIAVVSGQVSEEEYSQAVLGDLYVASQWANRNVPVGGRIALYEETRGYYLDRAYMWANPGHHDLIPYERLTSGRELVDQLRRFGITHVWITYDWVRGKEAAPWYRLLVGAIQTGELERVYATERSEMGRRGVMIYRLREEGR